MAEPDPLVGNFEEAVKRLLEAKPFARANHTGRVLDIARRLLKQPADVAVVYRHAGALDRAGVFGDSDWNQPDRLQPALVNGTFTGGNTLAVVLECLSELRMLAVAEGNHYHPGLSPEQAGRFLHRVLALNLTYLFSAGGEADRINPMLPAVRHVLGFIVERTGYEHILDQLVDEVWRMLRQRPIKVDDVKAMITNIAACLYDPDIRIGGSGAGAQRLVSALFGPTTGCQEDPGLAVYRERLESMDEQTLAQEASGFARAMHDTGLASPYHAVCLRYLLERHDHLIANALGLSSTGQDSLLTYRELVYHLIDGAIHPATAQAAYGLAYLLERAVLFMPAVAPALWRQLGMVPSATNEARIAQVCGSELPARVHLLAGVLSVLGQPLGVGQGDNPTCQSARAISMWAYNDPDYLLQVLIWAARDDNVTMHFEGTPLASRDIPHGMANTYHPSLDPVSLVLVPHLDRLYVAMGQLAADRGEDSHKWINPEFHGWWVGRGFAIAVEVASGKLRAFERFLRTFYGCYHPYFNGNQPVTYPQPAGIAVTDSLARFVGWHAITLVRVALDQEGVMRAYFYNPNNDGGQDWGNGVVVSTAGHGEYYGESSLPFGEFVSRLYLFHYDPLELGDSEAVAQEEIDEVVAMATASWAAGR